MAQQYDNTNRGIISKNDRKESDKHPDIKGEINIEGVDYWLDGWKKDRKDGSGFFYSLSAKPKQGGGQKKQTSKAQPAPESDDPFGDDSPF